MLMTMADKAQITFFGTVEWRDEINRRAKEDFGAAAKLIYLLGAHLLLRRSDAADLIDRFRKLDKTKAGEPGFMPGDPTPEFPDLPIGDALAGGIAGHKQDEPQRGSAPKGHKVRVAK